MPDWVRELLTAEAFGTFARVVLTSFFWIAGIVTMLKPAMIIAEVERAGLPMPKPIVAAMIATELGGSILLVSDISGLGWFGAGWLGVLTFLSILLGHPFWRFSGPKRMEHFQVALEHVTVIGGLMCAAALLATQP